MTDVLHIHTPLVVRNLPRKARKGHVFTVVNPLQPNSATLYCTFSSLGKDGYVRAIAQATGQPVTFHTSDKEVWPHKPAAK